MTGPWILLVESDVLVRNPLAEYLRECGYRVLEASTAEDARVLLADSSRQIDVALIEVDASGELGFGLAAWIRAHRPGTDAILAGTAARAAEKAGDLCEQGPDLARPYDHRVVLDRIRRLLGARRPGEHAG